MNTQILSEIGLTKTEIKIYLTLLRIGESTTTNIVRESGIHASKVYEFLDRLQKKGLATYVIQANKKHFSAANPEFLQEFLKEKQRAIEHQKDEIQALIPELQSLHKQGGTIPFKVYTGLRGIKSFYDNHLTKLKKENTSHVLGAPRIANEVIEGYLLDWHERRIKKGVKIKYIYDYDVRDYGKVREKMKYSKVRYLPEGISSPMWIEISGNTVGIGKIHGASTTIFSIEDKEIAKGYLDYFKLIWKMSEQ
ncbi:MAG: hypothetical protein OXR66_04130 [Candidatus Woesearchaeota archaeon]|nr:hypothetical protein [Candidatus Woesearchaeota archaeon]